MAASRIRPALTFFACLLAVRCAPASQQQRAAPVLPAQASPSTSSTSPACQAGPCAGVWLWTGTACEPLHPQGCQRMCARLAPEMYPSFDSCRNAHFFPLGGGPTPPAGPP